MSEVPRAPPQPGRHVGSIRAGDAHLQVAPACHQFPSHRTDACGIRPRPPRGVSWPRAGGLALAQSIIKHPGEPGAGTRMKSRLDAVQGQGGCSARFPRPPQYCGADRGEDRVSGQWLLLSAAGRGSAGRRPGSSRASGGSSAPHWDCPLPGVPSVLGPTSPPGGSGRASDQGLPPSSLQGEAGQRDPTQQWRGGDCRGDTPALSRRLSSARETGVAKTWPSRASPSGLTPEDVPQGCGWVKSDTSLACLKGSREKSWTGHGSPGSQASPPPNTLCNPEQATPAVSTMK